jgi:hypothetical protein
MKSWKRQEERKRSKEEGKREKGNRHPKSQAQPPRSGDCD